MFSISLKGAKPEIVFGGIDRSQLIDGPVVVPNFGAPTGYVSCLPSLTFAPPTDLPKLTPTRSGSPALARRPSTRTSSTARSRTRSSTRARPLTPSRAPQLQPVRRALGPTPSALARRRADAPPALCSLRCDERHALEDVAHDRQRRRGRRRHLHRPLQAVGRRRPHRLQLPRLVEASARLDVGGEQRARVRRRRCQGPVLCGHVRRRRRAGSRLGHERRPPRQCVHFLVLDTF